MLLRNPYGLEQPVFIPDLIFSICYPSPPNGGEGCGMQGNPLWVAKHGATVRKPLWVAKHGATPPYGLRSMEVKWALFFINYATFLKSSKSLDFTPMPQSPHQRWGCEAWERIFFKKRYNLFNKAATSKKWLLR